jgi:hypothetical protein
MQRFDPKFASLLWFFIGYWILKARLDFYPASYFAHPLLQRNSTVDTFPGLILRSTKDTKKHEGHEEVPL